jgi:hypothetical protein
MIKLKLTVFSLQILGTKKIPKLNHDFLGKFIAENTREDEIMSENEEFIEFEEEEGQGSQ